MTKQKLFDQKKHEILLHLYYRNHLMPYILYPTLQTLGNVETSRLFYRRKTGQCFDRSARNGQEGIVGKERGSQACLVAFYGIGQERD